MPRALALIPIAASLLTPAAFAQQTVQVSVDTLRSGRISDAVIRIVNGTSRTFDQITIGCAFMLHGKAVDTGMAIVSQVGAGQTVFDKVSTFNGPVDSVSCRVTDTDP